MLILQGWFLKNHRNSIGDTLCHCSQQNKHREESSVCCFQWRFDLIIPFWYKEQQIWKLVTSLQKIQIVSPRNYPVSHLTGTTTKEKNLKLCSQFLVESRLEPGPLEEEMSIQFDFFQQPQVFIFLFSNKCFNTISRVLRGVT